MNFPNDVSALAAEAEVDAILRELCDLTGMGFAAIARVTEHRWIACQVLDRIDFGLEAGNELRVKATICDEIRGSGEAVVIDCVDEAPMWRTHPVPILYGFQSYVSLPLTGPDGAFFGTLCAIDPEPHAISTPEMHAAMQALATRAMALIDTLPFGDVGGPGDRAA